VIAYRADMKELENATLLYTINNWRNVTEMKMAVSNMTCNATIPRQEAGSFVKYMVQATDTIKNSLTATGNFTVKYPSAIADFNVTKMIVTLGENITATGTLSAEAAGAPVTLTFLSVNSTEQVRCTALGNGTFTASLQPETTGNWTVQASFAGNSSVYDCNSDILVVMVAEQSFFAL